MRRWFGVMRAVSLVRALAVLAGCGGGGSSPSPADPIVSFTAEPGFMEPGTTALLRPVFTGGAAGSRARESPRSR